MSDLEKKMICKLHGESHATFICHHLAHGSRVGFYYGNEDDIRPDAWCYECDQNLMQNDGEWNDKTESFAKIMVICAYCYDNVRLLNEIPYKRIPPQSNPTIEENGWELVSAVRMNLLHPKSFHIPTASDINKLGQNSLVKLLFAFADDDNTISLERMWVKITEIDKGELVGTLETNPTKIEKLKPMTKIKFSSEHIASIIAPFSLKRIIRSVFSFRKFKWSSMKENEAYC
jgi:hypothetical protein